MTTNDIITVINDIITVTNDIITVTSDIVTTTNEMHETHSLTKSWSSTSGKLLATLHNIVSVLYLAMTQSFFTSSCASESREAKKSPVKCSESLPTACRTDVRSLRTAWSFSHSEASEITRVRAA